MSHEIHLHDPQTLYRHWEEQQWSPFEIDLTNDAAQWQELEGEDRGLIYWVLSSLMVAEERITTKFSGLVGAEASDSSGRGAPPLMVPVLVFLAIATIVGILIRGIVRLRLRAAARQPEVSEGDLCQLKQANRISSFAVIGSLAGLAVAGLAYVVL